jgi:hypothetical protein
MEEKMVILNGHIYMENVNLDIVMLNWHGKIILINNWKYKHIINGLILWHLLCIMLNDLKQIKLSNDFFIIFSYFIK